MMMFFVLLIAFNLLSITYGNYWENRYDFIQEEESYMLGSKVELSENEEKVNDILKKHKIKEYDAAFVTPGLFIPRRHFFKAKPDVEKSEVFKFIQKMPKGGALHGHDNSLVSNDFIYGLTTEDNLYACTLKNNRLKMKFLSDPTIDRTCEWTLMKTLLTNSSYDKWVRSQLTLSVENPDKVYPDMNTIWQAMRDVFETIQSMITYKPVFEKVFYQALKELRDDNVHYLEFRSELPLLYQLNGTYYDYEETVRVFQRTIGQFRKDYPDFIGARLIYSPQRQSDNPTLNRNINTLHFLQTNHRDLLAGFDIVGQEDLGRPLKDFVNQLEAIKNTTNFYFHSAETNWNGAISDLNLIDAVLLGTKRIGHGYGLIKHPSVMDVVKKNDIAIEICPISNQVLMLVDDMRNHPAATLIAEGFPLVISYDNPTCWNVTGLSYDFYMAFMGIASRNSDLKLLKQFAINSLQYSSLSEGQKELALKIWENKWDDFIHLVLASDNKQ